MLARPSRRLAVAVSLALIAHATVLYFAARVDHRADLRAPAPAPLRIQLRISSPRSTQTQSADLARAAVNTAKRRNQVMRAAEHAHDTERSAETPQTAVRPIDLIEPAAQPANSPRFDSDRVMQQAIQADRQRRAQRPAPLWAAQSRGGERAASSPFDALGGDQAATRVESASDSRGTRVEKITTLGGGYCVTTPNAATAYRHENGLNLSGAGNCPR